MKDHQNSVASEGDDLSNASERALASETPSPVSILMLQEAPVDTRLILRGPSEYVTRMTEVPTKSNVHAHSRTPLGKRKSPAVLLRETSWPDRYDDGHSCDTLKSRSVGQSVGLPESTCDKITSWDRAGSKQSRGRAENEAPASMLPNVKHADPAHCIASLPPHDSVHPMMPVSSATMSCLTLENVLRISQLRHDLCFNERRIDVSDYLPSACALKGRMYSGDEVFDATTYEWAHSAKSYWTWLGDYLQHQARQTWKDAESHLTDVLRHLRLVFIVTLEDMPESLRVPLSKEIKMVFDRDPMLSVPITSVGDYSKRLESFMRSLHDLTSGLVSASHPGTRLCVPMNGLAAHTSVVGLLKISFEVCYMLKMEHLDRMLTAVQADVKSSHGLHQYDHSASELSKTRAWLLTARQKCPPDTHGFDQCIQEAMLGLISEPPATIDVSPREVSFYAAQSQRTKDAVQDGESCSRETPRRDHVFWTFPETLYYDRKRLHALQADFRSLRYVHLGSLLFRQLLASHIRDKLSSLQRKPALSAHLRDVQSKLLAVTDRRVASATTRLDEESIIEDIVLQVLVEVAKVHETPGEPTVEQIDRMKQWFVQHIETDCTVSQILRRRYRKILGQLLNCSHDHHQTGHGSLCESGMRVSEDVLRLMHESGLDGYLVGAMVSLGRRLSCIMVLNLTSYEDLYRRMLLDEQPLDGHDTEPS